MKFEPVIGLEVHAQLKTHTKIFCSCTVRFEEQENKNTCPICTGMPGVLPVLNRKVVEFALKASLALNFHINPVSIFARKNYFYPDLPKGYQISQYDIPIAEHGYLEIEKEGTIKKFRIQRLHIEEDAGKNIHRADKSYLDFNRAGTALIEIVTDPDFRSAEEAASFVRNLRSVLQYLDVCDGNMEEGSLRCDANISLRPVGQTNFGIKAEVKNMNSFKFIEKALLYEIERQTELLEEGKKVLQETRLWDSDKGKTFSMRSKEFAHDYRYFPEPDLRPLVINNNLIEKMKKELPELPDQRRKRFVNQYGLPEYDALILTDTKNLADYYESCVTAVSDPKMVSNFIMTEVLRYLKKHSLEIQENPVTAENLSKLLIFIKNGTINGKIAKDIFREMFTTKKSATQIVQEKNLSQVSDESSLQDTVQKVLKNHPTEVDKYLGGVQNLFSFFMGQIMKETKGRANPQKVTEILKELLKTQRS
ncbi:MAG: Asp-tRNA(Asn)/Glu-tRNA(Gln) amidotransferase subunit GatB [Deltaproteobacteria bacterium]|nr:Asp-tRNA(Asn)/Glu-tRNA(Gln) amidotransferase subunit GatB [Deltaproteobacteria bacterium]